VSLAALMFLFSVSAKYSSIHTLKRLGAARYFKFQKILFFMFLNCFDVLILKIIFLKKHFLAFKVKTLSSCSIKYWSSELAYQQVTIFKSKVGHGDLQNLRETTKILGLFSSLAGLNFGRIKKIQYTYLTHLYIHE